MMKKISRRDFLKGSAAIAATGLLGACGSQEVPSATSGAAETTTAAATTAAAETTAAATQAATEAATEAAKEAAKAAFKAGTYKSTAYGNISNITVECTFSDTALTSVKVLEQGETPILFSQVEDTLIPAIIENQAGGVDAVTGATNSSRAVKEAIADCVAQAGGDKEAWLNKKVEVIPKQDETYDVDLAVIGCGAAGFMASITAGQAGLKVLTIEKSGSVAGVNGIKVSGPFAVDTSVLHAKEGGTTLTVDEVFQHVMEYSHWTPNPALMHRCLTESKNAVEKLVGIGYQMKEVNFRFETPFKDEKGGFHLITNPLEERVEMWEKALKDAGVEVLFNTQATDLIMDGRKAKGLHAVQSDGTKITVNAKAVIVAAGGYLGNRDLQEKFLKTRKLNAAAGGNSLCTGDGILMTSDAGAVLSKTFGYCPCEYGGTNSKATRPAKQDKYDQNLCFKFGLYGNLLVDGEGKRFINEGLLCDYPMSYGSEQIILNAPWYGIVDQAYVDAMATEGLYEYTTKKGANEKNWFIGNYFKDRILDKLPEDIEEGLKEGWLAKADTIEELGEKFGLTNLKETVEEYNKFCEDGVDAKFGTSPWYLSKVSQGPFYAVQCEPSAWSTFGGIRTDDSLRALDIENQPMEGLYVVGTDNGSLYYSPYYDVPGYCYGLCIDSGYIAATEAAEYIKA
ncbi:succinate dehydrogenase/fumarate reductase flavoprotein subunit [Lachnospiraceae bacterium JC7]|nr:succinate dehydrogenase/fumarate reductase flavoprotein subunit [Lachnospiraceae bacterium JC7]